MVVRVGIVGKNLHAVVVVDAGISRTCHAVGDSAFRNGVWRAILRSNRQRLSRGNKLSSIRAGFAQVHSVCTDVSNFKNPVAPQRTLHGEVPLLRIGRHEFSRNDQSEQKLRRYYTRTRSAARIIRRPGGISARKALKRSKTRHEGRIERSPGRQRIGIRAGEARRG